MPYCKNCGNFVDENAYACSQCGAIQSNTPATVDNGGFGWGLLGCCIPVVGLILYLVWKDSKPKTAKAAGKGALISVIVGVVFYIVYFVLLVALGVSMGGF